MLIDDFKKFLSDIQGASYYGKWLQSNPNLAKKWTDYRDAILSGQSPSAPDMSGNLFGQALVDVGILYLHTKDTPVPPTSTTLGGSLPQPLPESSGRGGTFYVDPTYGNDSSNGSSSTPWLSINKAINTVPLSGSIIMVRSGTFKASGLNTIPINYNRLGDVNDPITIKAVTPGAPRIVVPSNTGQSYGAWLRGSGLRIDGMTFNCITSPGSQVHTTAIAIESAKRIEIRNCTINEFGSVATSVRGPQAVGQTSDDIWFLSNIFRPSGADPFAQVTGCNFPKGVYYGSRGSHWVYAGQWGSNPASWDGVNGCRRLVVANNIFVGSTFGRDIELGPECRDSFVVNNTFYGNHAIQLYGNGDPAYSLNGFAAHDGGANALQFFGNTSTQQYESGNNKVYNNIFVDLDGHAAYGSGSTEAGNYIDHNVSFNLRNGYGWMGSSTADYEPNYGSSVLFQVGTNNIKVDPKFTDAAHYDFRPQATLSGANPDYCYEYNFDGVARSGATYGAF